MQRERQTHNVREAEEIVHLRGGGSIVNLANESEDKTIIQLLSFPIER